MTRRRFHPLHSKHELFRWNSHCFVTCAPLDLAMHYPWCYIATRKILISNKTHCKLRLANFLSTNFKLLYATPMRFPKISANQICMSPDLFIAKMDIERFGETSFPKTTDMSGGWNLSLPFKSPMIWGIWSFNKISVLSVCFDPYRYMPSPFGCHACTRNGLHEAIVPRTWIPARRSWPHRIHRQNYGIRTESLPAHNLITSVFC